MSAFRRRVRMAWLQTLAAGLIVGVIGHLGHAAWAQEIELEAHLEPGRIGIEQTTRLAISITRGGGGRVAINADFTLDNLEATGGPYRSTSFQFRNGATTHSERIAWRLRPQDIGTGAVRQIRVRVGDQVYELLDQEIEVQLEPTAAAQPQPSSPLGDPLARLLDFFPERSRGRAPKDPKVFLRAVVQPKNPYVGQQTIYTLYVYTQTDLGSVNPDRLPDFQGFWVREMPLPETPKPEFVELQGERFGRVRLLERALFPRRPGVIELDAAIADLVVQIPDRGFFSTFSRPAAVRRSSNAVSLDVRPLPPAPPDFSGAVGRLHFEARLSDTELHPGAAATLTLTLRGIGHLQGLPAPVTPTLPGIRSFPPQEHSEEKLQGRQVVGSRSWSYVLVPEHGGAWDIPPQKFPYFDPEAGEFRMASTQPLSFRSQDAADAATTSTSQPSEPDRNTPTSAEDLSAAWYEFSAIRWLPWLTPLAIAALFLGASKFVRRRGSGHRSERALLKRSLRKAAAAERPRQVAAEMEEAWKIFLQRRWDISPGSPTNEWSALLAAQGADVEAAGELVRLADDLHYLRYAPQLSSIDTLTGKLLVRSRKLLRSLG